MNYDLEAQHRQDQAHSLNPEPGDYWHDMYAPVARVLGTFECSVIFQRISGMSGKEIRDTDPPPEIMTLAGFKKWLSYDSMPDKTWAHVIPRRYPSET